MQNQGEFIWGDSESESSVPWTEDPLIEDIGREWGLPVGKRVRIGLRDGESLGSLTGKLEVARPPTMPFNRRQPLRLRVAGYEFLHTAIDNCVVV
jgi:hypothetical protein